jgi:hypothetical protein
MTEIEVITAANESGLVYYGMGKDRARFIHHLENFAALVAAHEREACAKVCDVLAVHPEYASEITKLAAMTIRARGTI